MSLRPASLGYMGRHCLKKIINNKGKKKYSLYFDLMEKNTVRIWDKATPYFVPLNSIE
jgi:hypothetical protein